MKLTPLLATALTLLASVAHAETISMIVTQENISDVQAHWIYYVPNTHRHSCQEAADWYSASTGVPHNCAGETFNPHPQPNYIWIHWYRGPGDEGTFMNGKSWVGGCREDTVWDGAHCVLTTYSCPTTGGWLQQGNACVRPDCAEGEFRDQLTGACWPEKGLGQRCN